MTAVPKNRADRYGRTKGWHVAVPGCRGEGELIV